METKNITCIICPQGCEISVCVDEGNIVSVSGNKCPRGKAYASAEATLPVRTVTSSVKLSGGDVSRLPVKTKNNVPKDKIFDVLADIKKITVTSPVKAGDVIAADIGGTGVALVATRNG